MRSVKRRMIAGACLLAWALMAPVAAAQTASAAVDDLAWLVGHWVGTTARGAHVEEMWMPAIDGHMVGSFRWARGNGRWLLEFMTIERGDPGTTAPASSSAAASTAPLVLRIKHFDRVLRGLEEKDVSTMLALVEHSATHAVFEFREGARTVRVGYRRDGPDGLTATFDETQPGQPAAHLEFPYKRVP